MAFFRRARMPPRNDGFLPFATRRFCDRALDANALHNAIFFAPRRTLRIRRSNAQRALSAHPFCEMRPVNI
jgi:hypothetical protein